MRGIRRGRGGSAGIPWPWRSSAIFSFTLARAEFLLALVCTVDQSTVGECHRLRLIVGDVDG
jgi:hypothetical protein